MASKLLTTTLTFLFLFFFLSSSTTAVVARPVPDSSPRTTTRDGIKVMGDVLEEEGCDEVGEEYCLMKKTLAAHADYIYTDKHKP